MNAVVPIDKLVLLYSDLGINLKDLGDHSHITEENNLLAKAMSLIKDELEMPEPAGVEEEHVSIYTSMFLVLCFSVLFIFNQN